MSWSEGEAMGTIQILGISASPRQGGTEAAVQKALDSAAEFPGVQTEFISLRGKDIRHCVHCNRCMKVDTYHCPQFEDDMEEIYPRIMDADAYIFGSPVYQMNPSAQLFSFFNRLRPLGKLTSKGGWGAKVAGSVVVGGTRNGGQDTALESLNNLLFSTGMIVVSGGVYAYNGGSAWVTTESRHVMEDDQIGAMTVKVLGRRVAVVASLIREGRKHCDFEGFNIAGFLSEQEARDRVALFRKG